MDRDRALAIQQASLGDYIRMIAAGSRGARMLELDGVAASITPAARTRSIPNSVTYRDAAALAAAHAELEESFREAEIEAWTVWVPEFDKEAIELLTRAGHAFDGSPVAMSLALENWRGPDLGDLDWDSDGDGLTLGEINDRAYTHPGGEGFAGGLAALAPAGSLRLYRARARAGGEPACVLGTIDHAHDDGTVDCGVYFVATDPAHQGRGLATRLMAAALTEARERGCTSSALQASAAGRPIYEALGYEADFSLHLYELRRG
jgi:GNAT superfamily N-acetyltransferase